jgi:hypothetical protein
MEGFLPSRQRQRSQRLMHLGRGVECELEISLSRRNCYGNCFVAVVVVIRCFVVSLLLSSLFVVVLVLALVLVPVLVHAHAAAGC